MSPLPVNLEVMPLSISPSISMYDPNGSLSAVPIPEFGTSSSREIPVVISEVKVNESPP